MAEFSLGWTPEDYLDVQWLEAAPLRALGAARVHRARQGRGDRAALRRAGARDALRRDRRSRSRRSSTTWTSDGSSTSAARETPEVTIGHLVRVAIALPLFIESVPVHGHLYVDGGIIEVWPIQPVLDDGGFDHVIGVNFMLPRGLRAQGHHRLAGPSRRALRGQPPAPAGLPPRARAPGACAARRQADADRPGRRLRATRHVLLRPLPRPQPLAAADPPGLRRGERSARRDSRPGRCSVDTPSELIPPADRVRDEDEGEGLGGRR